MSKIFVYGSLKTGYSNHHLLGKAKGYPAMAPHLDIYAGPNYPFAIKGRGRTFGEVYEINHTALRKLDQLEQHPHDYHRQIIRVILNNGNAITAWTYLNSKAYRYPRIHTGNW
jgi:gamma-glutamylcyclotransferase (GGCT)/AIG2-like uncharacterized protein YtfP